MNGQIRQDPGPKNPLGKVKFLFLNPYDVYLHDTNSPQLFERWDRFLSHGCMRVAAALDLAGYLLKDDPRRILTWLIQAKQKDASIEPFLWSRLIGDVETFRVLPRMIVPLQLPELIAFYRNVRRLILASLKPPAA